MNELFDGSNAHLLPGNAELIERLRRPFVMSMFANRGDLYEASECERHEAADALEAADKRIAELERKMAVAQEALEVATTYSMLEIDRKIIVEALAQIGGNGAG